MWRIRRLAILPVLALLITAMAAISMPLANAGTSPDRGKPACALEHNGLLRYAAVPAECGHQGKSAAPSQHKPPVLANIESSALKYAAGAPPVRVTPSLTAASTATATLAGATVTVSSGLAAGQDALAFAAQSGITASYNASTGVLTFTGTATVSAYTTELRSVTYTDTNPATPYRTGTISFQVTDGEPDNSLSNVESRTVLVTAKPPVAAGDKAATGKNAPVTISVLANDTDPAGLPLTIASVSTTGTKGAVTVNPGQTTVTYNPNGQFAGLAAGKTATDKFTYKATDGTQTSNSATVTVTITVSSGAPQPPTVTAHSYTAVGNTPLGVGTHPAAPAAIVSGTVLSGDSDSDPTGTLSVTATTAPAHGAVTVNPNGTFTYLPNLGYTGTDSFQATVAGSSAPAVTATETVTINVGKVVWYVDDSQGGGNGEAGSPFGTLAAAAAAAGANSVVFLYQGNAPYTGGVIMQPREDLWGQPHGLTVDGYSLVPAGGSPPAINGSGADGLSDGIDLAEGADVEGVDVTGPSGSGIAAVNVNNATVGTTTPVAVSGALSGIVIEGGAGNLDFGATSVTDGSSYGVVVDGHYGGTVTFGGPVTGPLVGLNNNGGATIAFTGTLTLSGNGGGGGFTATGGGTVTATGPGSTLTGIQVQNTTIGAAGLTFQSVSTSGSDNYAHGIDLDNTGSSGGLTVTGTGTPGSGGTIQNSQEAGIQLTSTDEPSFTDMVIQGNLGGAIYGSQVNELTLADSTVSQNGTEGGVGGVDITPGGSTDNSASVIGSTFTDNYGNAFQFGVDAWTTTRTGTYSATFSNNTVDNTAGGNSWGGVLIAPGRQSTIAVDGNNIQNTAGDGIEIDGTPTGALTGTVQGNTIGAPTAAGSGGATGIGVSASGSTDLTITGNHLYQYSNAAGINFSNTGSLDLTITGNTIADPGANGHWGIHGQDGASRGDVETVCAAITGNSIAGSGRASYLGGADVELDQNDATTIQLPGYTGGSGDVSAVESFLAGGNDGDGTPTAVATVSGNGGGFAGVTGC
jgi:VCBS repeat-containing protein